MKHRDYNHLKQWLLPKLDAKGLSFERFAQLVGVSRASVYFWVEDVTRPSTQSMVKVCEVLGESLTDGLAQFTPKVSGRPVGYSPNQQLAVRRR